MSRASLRVEPAAAQPLDEHAGPAFVVGAGGEFGDVVGGRVALEAGDLAEIIHGVRGVGGAAADAEDERRPPRSRTRAVRRRIFDRRRIRVAR